MILVNNNNNVYDNELFYEELSSGSFKQFVNEVH